MKITLNDKQIETPDNATVAQVMEANGISSEGIATAVNGDLVKAVDRAATSLKDGDTLLIIKAFYGG